MRTLQECVALARSVLSDDDRYFTQLRTFDRTDKDGVEWLVVEAFSTRAPSLNPVPEDKIERREAKMRFKRRPGLHADIELHEATIKLHHELFELLKAEQAKAEHFKGLV